LWLLGNWWEQDAANAEFRHEDRHQERAPQLALRTSEAFEVRIEGTTSRALHRLGARHPFDSVFAPRTKQQANGRLGLPALIEGIIPLPSLLRLRRRSYIEELYREKHLSGREISRLTKVSRSMVLEALDRFGIPQNGNGHKRTGHLPFGFDYLNYKVVKNKAEQDAIRMMRQYRAGGLSL
jgi:hypothetical protein